ncbi:hypothetical protein ACFLX0_03715 [Chloroflexota bacterium]
MYPNKTFKVLMGAGVLLPNIKLFFTPAAQRAWMVFKISSPYLVAVYLAVFIDMMLSWLTGF